MDYFITVAVPGSSTYQSMLIVVSHSELDELSSSHEMAPFCIAGLPEAKAIWKITNYQN